MNLVHLLSKTLKSQQIHHHHHRSHSRIFSHQLSTSFLTTKIPRKFRKKRKKKESPRTKKVQTPPNLAAHFEDILLRDDRYRFLTKTKDYLSKQPLHVLRLDDAGKLHQQLGFPRGRKVLKSLSRHPLIFQTYRHTDDKIWLGFTDFMEGLLHEEEDIMNETEQKRVTVVKKLLMMSKNQRIPLSTLHHNRHLFGFPTDFRDRVTKYPDCFKVVIDSDGRHVLELSTWDSSLAVSALEGEYLIDEDKAKKAFRFPVKHGRSLDLDLDDERKLNVLNALPLVSPYTDGSRLDSWTLEAEKYRVGILHEFLSLTMEKRAYIHNIVEFKDEFSLTRRTYDMLLRQPRTFYVAGTEMNWCVFVRDGYGDDGDLVCRDPQVVFNERLYGYADMQEMGEIR